MSSSRAPAHLALPTLTEVIDVEALPPPAPPMSPATSSHALALGATAATAPSGAEGAGGVPAGKEPARPLPIPTLTEIAVWPPVPKAESAAVADDEPVEPSPAAVPPAGQDESESLADVVDAVATPDPMAELQERIERIIEPRLREAVGPAVDRLVEGLMNEMRATVRQAVAEALADQAAPRARGRSGRR